MLLNKELDLHHVAKNLQTLAASFDSVSGFCRKLAINRQQFNKYIAGQHLPSQKILLKIARYFMMEPHHLSMAPGEFAKFYDGLETDIPVDFKALPNFMQFVPAAVKSTAELRKFHGVYIRYHNSSIYKGRILRSLVWIYEKESVTQYVTIERFQKLDGSGQIGFVFKYNGFCFLLGDRLFLVDFEGDQKNEMTFTTLVPQPRTPIKYMHGIVNGIAATSYRQPFSTRVILESAGPGPMRRKHLRMGAALLPSDLSLPLEVREYLTGAGAGIVWGGAD